MAGNYQAVAAANEPRTVYLVWTGCYSDKQVIAVFEQSEHAQEFVAKLRDARLNPPDDADFFPLDWEDARVEPKVLNTESPTIYLYECLLSEGGNVEWLESVHVVTLSACPSQFPNGTFHAFGTTREEAVKNCADFRRMWLATRGE